MSQPVTTSEADRQLERAAQALADVRLQLVYNCGVSSVDATAILEMHTDEILSRAAENPYTLALELVERATPR